MKNLTKNNNTIGTILGSVFITLLLVGTGAYFGLPALFPNLNADLGDYVEKDDLTGEGILLQTKYVEVQTSSFFIRDDDQVYQNMPDTELNITTTGNSKLNVVFIGAFFLQIYPDFFGYTKYNITLDISGVGNRTTSILYLSHLASGIKTEISDNVQISFETEVLPAGTYSISVLWKSSYTIADGMTLLILKHDIPRSIYAQEIAG